MEPEFWLDRWREGRTNFHQNKVMPLLQKHWSDLSLPPGSRVLVPLCGKSLDMMWLASQGYEVLGVELSELAAEQFFEEHGLTPHVSEWRAGRVYRLGNIEFLCGDIFDMDPEDFQACAGVYDRAALIALPPDMRKRYVQHVYSHLPSNYRGLLITLDYPQEQLQGPPFSVPDDEVQALFGPDSIATVLERRDILAEEAKFRDNGVQRLDTLVYRLGRHPGLPAAA